MCTLKSAHQAQLVLLPLFFLLSLFSLPLCLSVPSPNKPLALTLLRVACLLSGVPWQGPKGTRLVFLFLPFWSSATQRVFSHSGPQLQRLLGLGCGGSQRCQGTLTMEWIRNSNRDHFFFHTPWMLMPGPWGRTGLCPSPVLPSGLTKGRSLGVGRKLNVLCARRILSETVLNADSACPSIFNTVLLVTATMPHTEGNRAGGQ